MPERISDAELDYWANDPLIMPEVEKALRELQEIRAERAKASPDVSSMVERFLRWPLPASLCADPIASVAGACFRSGTNLMTAEEARQMFEHCLAGVELPKAAAVPDEHGIWTAVQVDMLARHLEMIESFIDQNGGVPHDLAPICSDLQLALAAAPQPPIHPNFPCVLTPVVEGEIRKPQPPTAEER